MEEKCFLWTWTNNGDEFEREREREQKRIGEREDSERRSNHSFFLHPEKRNSSLILITHPF